MIPLMPSLAKGTHAFRPSQQTVGVGINQSSMSDGTVARGSMGPPEPPMELPSSDEELPPQSSPPRPASVHSSYAAASVTSSQKRKHVALTSASESFQSSSFGSGPSEKKQRTSGVSVLGGIKESIDEFKTIMRNGMPVAQIRAADRAAAYRVQAMDKVQTAEPDLNDDQVVALMDLFRTDSSAAEAYMAIVRPAIRQAWLNKQLKQLGFPDQTLLGADRQMVE